MAQVLFDNTTDGLDSAEFSIPAGFIAFFRVMAYDGKAHCIDLIEVLSEPQQPVVGGLSCDGSGSPGFLDSDTTTVPHYKNCHTALLSTGSTNWTLSLLGVFKLRLQRPESEKQAYVSMELVPISSIPSTWSQYEIGTQDCGCDTAAPCPSYPIDNGFIYGPGDVVDPEATVEIQLCGYEGVWYAYPNPGTYGALHATIMIEAPSEEDCTTRTIVGYAANWSPCGQNPSPSCGC
jgi:hypothetical protein